MFNVYLLDFWLHAFGTQSVSGTRYYTKHANTITHLKSKTLMNTITPKPRGLFGDGVAGTAEGFTNSKSWMNIWLA